MFDEQYAGLQFKCSEYRLTRKAENEQNSHKILAILCRVGTEGGARATSEHSNKNPPPPPPFFVYFVLFVFCFVLHKKQKTKTKVRGRQPFQFFINTFPAHRTSNLEERFRFDVRRHLALIQTSCTCLYKLIQTSPLHISGSLNFFLKQLSEGMKTCSINLAGNGLN